MISSPKNAVRFLSVIVWAALFLVGAVSSAYAESPEEKNKSFDDIIKELQTNTKLWETSGQKAPPVPEEVIQIREIFYRQIPACWDVPEGSGYSSKPLVATLVVSLERDGTVTGVDYEDKSRYNTDAAFHALVDSAVQAIYACSPLKDLPPETYERWHKVELTFDPGASFRK